MDATFITLAALVAFETAFIVRMMTRAQVPDGHLFQDAERLAKRARTRDRQLLRRLHSDPTIFRRYG